MTVNVYVAAKHGRLRRIALRTQQSALVEIRNSCLGSNHGPFRGPHGSKTRQRLDDPYCSPMKRFLIATVVALGWAWGAPALATVYKVRSCGSAPSTAFTWTNSPSANFTAGAQCPAAPASLLSGIFAVPRASTNTPDGELADG